ncbi:MAG TPA: histidine kinase [Solirubrobacteraceae bacterium]
MTAERRARALDVAIVLAGSALTLFHLASETVAGPAWLVHGWFLLIDVPLLWRRTRPLAAWTVICAGIALQALVTGNSPEGFELMLPLYVGSYSVAAYGSRREAYAGLAVGLAAYTIYALENHDIQTGKQGELWAGAFFGTLTVAFWLLGIFVRSRREAAALERRAAAAVSEERARMARELHDIVSHNLSVVVVQAAGARAREGADAGTLEKIERSGRDALVEMRRLLGVLREDGDGAGVAPQPGLSQLEALAAGVREAGLPVELTVEGVNGGLPPAVELSAYRIVQEALTNALKHAGPAHARVSVRREPSALAIEVVDDGGGAAADGAPRGAGHGLIGMRERVALFGGELRAAPRPEGGFAVSARLPL